jgi:pilus assembly protein CpaF
MGQEPGHGAWSEDAAVNVEVVVEASTGHRHVAHMAAEGPLSVGRGEECDVQLDDHHVSRQHVLLFAEPSALRVQDVSTNGTLAGDQLLRGGSIDVAYGTPILLGFHTIYVRSLESSASPPKPVALAPVVPLHPTARTEPPPPPVPPVPSVAEAVQGAADGALRREIHRRLLEHLDLATTETSRLDDPSFRPRVLSALRRIMKLLEDRIGAGVDRDQLVGEMADEALGLGPLEHLLSDPAVSEIMVIDANTIYVERAGKIAKSPQHFTDDERVRAVIERIVTPLGRRIDESSPLVDARLPDGSRVNAIIKPLALKGSCITIRKFPKSPLTLQRLYDLSALSPAMGLFLTRSVIAKKNIVISGGTGSGKTTLLNVLSAFIPEDERIVTIEDSAELRLEQPHVVSLETRPPNMEGKGQYTIRDLVKNALRMRPDRIVVGECRGGEALDMLQAMNTGHDGSLTTTHANSPAEALARLETLCLMAGVELPSRAIREQIASSVQLLVQQTRLSDGSRKVVAISEVCGLDERGDFELRKIYGFDRRGTGPNGEVLGAFVASGYLPSFLDELIVRGLIKPGERYL